MIRRPMPTIKKSDDAFRTIAEVSAMLGVEQHALRYWESQFKQVKPVKRKGNRRLYRPSDIRLIAGLKKLLHEDNYTLKGVQKILGQKGVEHVATLGSEYLLDRGLIEDTSGEPERELPEAGGTEDVSPQRSPDEGFAFTPISTPDPVDTAVPFEEGGSVETEPTVVDSEAEAPAEVAEVEPPAEADQMEPHVAVDEIEPPAADVGAQPPAEVPEIEPPVVVAGAEQVDGNVGAAPPEEPAEGETEAEVAEVEPPAANAEADVPARGEHGAELEESLQTVNVSARGHEMSISPDVINGLSPVDFEQIKQLIGRLEKLRDRGRNDIRSLRSKFGLASDP